MKKVTKKTEINWWFLKPIHDNPEKFFIRKEGDGKTYWFIGHEDNWGLIHNEHDVDDWTSNDLEEEFQKETLKDLMTRSADVRKL